MNINKKGKCLSIFAFNLSLSILFISMITDVYAQDGLVIIQKCADDCFGNRPPICDTFIYSSSHQRHRNHIERGVSQMEEYAWIGDP